MFSKRSELPVRWRLTLWYTGLLCTILLILGGMVYFLLNYSLRGEMERSIENKANEVLKSTKVVSSLPFFLRQVVLPDVEVFAAPDIYVQVVTNKGEVAARSKNLSQYSLPLNSKVFEDLATGKRGFYEFSVEDEKLLMIVKPIQFEDVVVGFLQVARPLKPVLQTLGRLRIILIMGGLASLLASLWLGWFMSGKVLKPVTHITEEARKIGAEKDFKRRISYQGPKDELGMLAVTFDDMLESLEEAYSKLEDSLEMQKRFVADASHELRTPLTSIQGNVDFLLQLQESKGNNENIRHEALADISSETKRLSRLVKELLTLAKVDAGLKLSLEPLELYPALEEIVRKSRFLVKGQNFAVEIKEAKGVYINGDRDYFQQLLLIFFDNAFKYTPPHKEVLFKVKIVENWVSLLIEDEGVGIPAQDIPHLFERFYRSDKSRTGEGTGLGLAIAQWIVKEHQGKIEVQSIVGEGTKFIIYLPFFRLF